MISIITLNLNDNWKFHWSTGQRGGAPYFFKAADSSDHYNAVRNIKRELHGSYNGGWFDATVPGEVHLDLMRAGIIDDPNVGINSLKCRWVEEMEWYYRKEFEVDEDVLCSNAFLHFEELDLSAKIYLNGKEIARHNNAFYPLNVDVSGILKQKNELVVQIESGLYDVCDASIRDQYTATADTGVLLTKRMYMRKPQYEAEWDWSPRLLNVGISGNVELRYSKDIVIDNWQVRHNVAEDLNSATITANIFSLTKADDKKYRLELHIGGEIFSTTATADKLSVSGVINNPKLWYPVGYGEQYLYQTEIKLYDSETLIWSKSTETGFRRVTVDTSKHEKEGYYFIISVNNRRVFFKGANFVPASLIPAEVSAKDYEILCDRALEANFNMLRVWGGGLYEKEEFYDICNRKGILIWQDFICACAYPPYLKDKNLYADMLREAEFQVKRLSRNPSLVVWSGNNELNPDGHPIFMEDFPRIIKENDPEKYYQPASPYTDQSLDGIPKGNHWYYGAGDQHPWEVGFLNKDHRDYRKLDCRFPNEGGILGPTNRKAFEDITSAEGDYTKTIGYEIHDNTLHYQSEGTSPDEDLRYWTGLMPSELPLEKYLVAGGFVQGEGLSDYIDNFRSRAYSSSSAVFWMFNDCWPASRSWTIVDNKARRNMSFYQVKRAFNPVRVVLKEKENGFVDVVCINDSDKEISGKLVFGMFLSDSDIKCSRATDVLLPQRSVTTVATLENATAKSEEKGSLPVAFAVLSEENGKIITRNRLLTHRYFEYSLNKPCIKVIQSGDEFTFISDSFVLGVCLDLDGEDGISDNMFDLYPNMPYTVIVKNTEKGKALYTLNDIINS